MLPEPDAPICASGKHPFRTSEEASRGLRAAQYLRHNHGPGYKPGCIEADVIECKSCGWFHLTSAKRPRRRSHYANRARRAPKRR